MVATLVSLSAAPAAADGGWGTVDCSTQPANPQCVIQVGTPAAPGRPACAGTSGCRDGAGRVVPCFVPGVGWWGGDGCYYQPAVGQDLTLAEVLGGPAQAPARWYVGRCGYPPIATLTRYRVFGTAPGPQLLADEAVKALRLPAPAVQLNPAPPAAQIVFVPMWVWLGPQSWGSRSATASVPGMSVTATATPVRLVLATAGQQVTCTGAGTAWQPGRDPESASPTCGHTYTQPGMFPVLVTVTWSVSWTGGGAAGTAPPMTTTASMLVPVADAPALNSGRPG